MELFGVGPLELMLILIVGLVIIGPAKLPEIARNTGRAINQFKAQTDELRKLVSLDTTAPPAPTAHIAGITANPLPDARLAALERFLSAQPAPATPAADGGDVVEVLKIEPVSAHVADTNSQTITQ